MIVYRVKNKQNGKCYVGLTTKTLEERWRLHIKNAPKAKRIPLAHAIMKYGDDAFELSVIEHCDSEQSLREREIFWINELNTFTPNGYNATQGGDGLLGYHHTDDAKRSMSEKRKGKLNHNFGKVWGLSKSGHTFESKAKIALANAGEKNGMFGKTHSEEARKKIAEAGHNRARIKRAVYQCDIEGNVLAEYESADSAAIAIKGCRGKVYECCMGRRKTHHKFMWRYVEQNRQGNQ